MVPKRLAPFVVAAFVSKSAILGRSKVTITIHQFMWGFQHLFRWRVEYQIQQVLSHIGLQVNTKSKVLLIGFATRYDLPHAVCIEPEHGPLVVDDLQSIKRRAEEIRADGAEANTNSL